MAFKCRYCESSLDTIPRYVKHTKMHRNRASFRFPCGVAQCPSQLKTACALQTHMYRKHSATKPVRHTHVDFTCRVERCCVSCADFSSLCAHLKLHISCGEMVHCPFSGCDSEFRVKSSFTSHVSRKHKGNNVFSDVESVCEASEHNESVDFGNENLADAAECAQLFDSLGEERDKQVFLTNLALFYLRMQAKMILPASTISTLIEEFEEICTNAISHMFVRLRKEMSRLGIAAEAVDKIIDGLSRENLLKMYNEGHFRSDATRKTYFKKNFSFVAPVQVRLGLDASGKERFCQYVPVKETLKVLLSSPSVKEQYNLSRIRSADLCPDVLEDLRDGKTVRENLLLRESPSSLSIILYQDAFEVVNPLSSGRKKHKLLGVYLTLGDILPHNRSSIDPIQLVMLCRQADFEYFGQERVFSSLVKDLKDIETYGIAVSGDEPVKGALIAIVGDNLGSHSLGGFNENFSKSKYFCRYCLIERNVFMSEPTRLGPSRTPESYTNSLRKLALVPEKSVDGVKSDCVFNALDNFHICQPALPPCLGHDLFEGVVSLDLKLFLDHLVNTGKHFTFLQLNRSISQIQLKGSDANNRPCTVKPDAEKIGGTAAQNWCLLRLLPVLVGARIKNPLDDHVWQLCLMLRKIVEIVCAPKIHTNQVAYLKVLVEEYVSSRATLFADSSLKPKHHYLLHYPTLILQFGPLIRVWTLRFESKHTYFKECARKLHNFKNLGSTLAERHQLLQAYLLSGSLFPPMLQVAQCDEFDSQLYNDGIQRAVSDYNHLIAETACATYKGTMYRKGMAVLLGGDESGYEVGKIVILLVNQQELCFVCEKLMSVSAMDLGIYVVKKNTPLHYVCVPVSDLADYHPLTLYKLSGHDVIALHHSVFSDE